MNEAYGFQHACDCQHINCTCTVPVLCTHGTSVPCICNLCAKGVHDYYDTAAERRFTRPINPDPVTAIARAAK